MTIKLHIYKTRSLKEIEKTYEVEDFKLSFGACEDLLNAIDIDKFDSGLEALSDENKNSEIFKSVVNALPVLKDIYKDVFEGLNDDELKRVSIDEIVSVTTQIIVYSFNALGKSIGNQKN